MKSLVLVCCTVLLLSACSRKINFMNSQVVPAATGKVSVKKDKNNNYRIGIDIDNLAESNRLQPAKKTYVVWMESAQNGPQNLGQLNSSSGLLSSKLKASFNTTSPVQPTKIYLTAEDDGTVQYPGGTTVLSTQNF